MASAKADSRPKKRESRPAATERLSKCLLGGDNFVNSTTTLRLQRLASSVGISGRRAELIAGLAWGEVQLG